MELNYVISITDRDQVGELAALFRRQDRQADFLRHLGLAAESLFLLPQGKRQAAVQSALADGQHALARQAGPEGRPVDGLPLGEPHGVDADGIVRPVGTAFPERKPFAGVQQANAFARPVRVCVEKWKFRHSRQFVRREVTIFVQKKQAAQNGILAA